RREALSTPRHTLAHTVPNFFRITRCADVATPTSIVPTANSSADSGISTRTDRPVSSTVLPIDRAPSETVSTPTGRTIIIRRSHVLFDISCNLLGPQQLQQMCPFSFCEHLFPHVRTDTLELAHCRARIPRKVLPVRGIEIALWSSQ